MEKKRLVGVMVIGIIVIIIGLLHLFLSIETLRWCFLTQRLDYQYFIISAFFGISFVISGIFLLKFKKIARILTIFLMIYLTIILIVFRPFYFLMWLRKTGIKGFFISLISWLICVVLPCAIVIYYLTRPKVKEQFK